MQVRHGYCLRDHSTGGMNLDVHRTVLENKETESGCTLHLVTEEVDAGKILMQKKVAIGPEETPESLKDKVPSRF